MDADWKQKYLENLDKLERAEKSWRGIENLLRQSVTRVALAAQGVDGRLDKQLNQLRRSIRSGEPYPGLDAIIEDISASVKRIDDKRTDAKANTPMAVLSRLLDELNLPKAYKRRLKSLQKSILKTDITELDSHVRELAGLLNAIAQGGESPSGSATLLGRLFGKQDTNATTDTAHESTAELASSASRSETVTNTRVSSTPHSATANDSEIAEKRLRGLLTDFCLQLVASLSFPEEFAAQLEDLQEQIETGVDLSDTGAVLKRLADLITAARLRMEQEKLDLQSFLQQLTIRLQDIDQHLAGAESTRKSAVERHKQLDDQMREQVQGIQDSVHKATDLGNLKLVIQERLDAIRRHLADHQLQENTTQHELQNRLLESNNRLLQLEEESEDLRVRLTQQHAQATRDALTGINNRLAYEERIQTEFARWKRYGQPLSLLVFDVDLFKQINDNYGHKAGDKALRLIARALTQNIRDSDFLARYGGEEFVIVMPETSLPAAMTAAEKLRAAVEQIQFHYQQMQVSITVSGGGAVFSNDDNPDSAFQRADQALYQAKREGRNRCCSGDR